MLKNRILSLFIAAAFLLGMIFGAVALTSTHLVTAHTDSAERLFVNVTTDDLNTAAMAISFGTRILKDRGSAVTIFLNVDAVRLVDMNIPEPKHASGMTPREMLSAFMEAGGEVIVCPMCMHNVGGMVEADVMEGVKIGSPDLTWGRLFGDEGEKVTVISY